MNDNSPSALGAEQRLLKIFSRVLEREIPDGESVVRENEPKWDSLKHIELVFAVEDAFSVQFEGETIPHLNSLDDFVAALEKSL